MTSPNFERLKANVLPLSVASSFEAARQEWVSTGNLFDSLKRIAQDDTANANNDLIEHAYRMGYLV